MSLRLFSILTLLGLIFSAGLARATNVNESFTSSSGDWATASNWSLGAAPNNSVTNSGNVTNVGIVTGGDTAIVDTSVPTFTDFVIGGTSSSGIIDINSGGSMTNTGNSFVGRNSTAGVTATLNINGGSLLVQSELNIGGAANTTQSTATMTVTNGGTYSGGIELGTTNSLSTGTLIISGTGNTIGAASSSDVFHMYTYGTLDFVLSGSGGVSELSYASGNTVTLAGTLDINVSNYTGGSETLNLINYSTLVGSFSNVAVIGTGASNYTLAYTNNAGTDTVQAVLTEVAVPEPETWALFFMGAAVLGIAVRRRTLLRS